MVQISELVRYCEDTLDTGTFHDYAPNGLQVEGRERVTRIVSGVTASQRFLERAIDGGADAVLVHHGYFWKGEDARIVGMKARRLRLLITAGVSLLAYHLPLDAHPTLGNNVQLANRLGIIVDGFEAVGGIPGLLLRGHLAEPCPGSDFGRRLETTLGRAPVHVAGSGKAIQHVAVCTGAAQRFLPSAAQLGVDAFVSGEISEPTAHEARELGVHYFSAGHHATERYGVQALGRVLADAFDLWHEYLDDDNPA